MADLARRGLWADILHVLDAHTQHSARLPVANARAQLLAALPWRVRALRALGRGAEANAALFAGCAGSLQASRALALELAEELVQCAGFDLVRPLIEALGAHTPEGAFLHAAWLRERGLYPAALQALAPCLAAQPGLAEAARCWVYIRLGWLRQAHESLATLGEPARAAHLKLAARFWLAAGEAARAAALLQRCAQAQPLDWEWPPLLAAAQASLGQPLPDCLRLLEQGLLRQPRQAEAWSLRVRLHVALGQPEAAQQALAQALALKPWLDQAALPLIEHLCAQRQFAAALALGRKLRQQLPPWASAPLLEAAELDVLRAQGEKKAQVLALAERLQLRYPQHPGVLRTCAAALLACGRPDPAARLLETALALNPYDWGSRNNLASVCKDRGDLDDAIAHWRALLAHDPASARLNLAQALTQRGDFAHAQVLWDEIEAQAQAQAQLQAPVSGTSALPAPTQALICRGRAELAWRTGQSAAALALVERAVALEPEQPNNALIHAQLLASTQGADAALAALQAALPQVHTPLPLQRALFEHWRSILTPPELVRRCQAWVAADAHEVAYRLMLAQAHEISLDYAHAEATLAEAARLDPAQAYVPWVRFLLARGRFGAAERVAQQWVRDDTTDIRRWAQLAEVRYLEGKLDAALEAVDSALALDPARLSLVRQKYGLLMVAERYDEAAALVRTQWQARGEIAALRMLLRVLERQQQFDAAIALVREALALKPGDLALRLALARQLRVAQQHEASAQVLSELLAAEPDNDRAARALVRTLMRLHRRTEALAVLERFVAHQPQRFDLRVALAEVALEQGLLERARAMLEHVRTERPDLLDAWVLSARLAQRSDDRAAEADLWSHIAQHFPTARWLPGAWQDWLRLDLDAALSQHLDAWRAREPHNPAPWWAAFKVAQKLNRRQVALDMLEGVKRRTGISVDYCSARASLASENWQMTQAREWVDQALALAPTQTRLIEQKIGIDLKAGDWSSFDADFDRLCYLLSDQRFAAYEHFFFNANCHPDWSPERLYTLYHGWGERVVRPRLALPRPWPAAQTAQPQRRLRVGYVSPDFRQHAVAKFSEPMLAAHEREQFELYAYAHLEAGQHDAWTQRFQGYFHHWREIRHWSLDELERQVRDDQIDILIDLAGHTSHHRLALFERRVAPVQMTHIIGSGQTTGSPAFDYLLCDNSLWPSRFEAQASERIARVPWVGLPYQPPTDAPLPAPLPSATSGAARGSVVFGVFARPIRTNHRTIRVWAQILHRVPGSRLRFEHAPYLEAPIADRFRAAFAQHGIEAQRLEFAHTRPYWNAFHGIDIQLDPFPAGSATTATEGLYMGRLSVTLRAGPGMGHTTAAQLEALGLGHLCCADTEAQYVELAVQLAQRPDLPDLCAPLREQFLRSPLCDGAGYAHALASTLRQCWVRFCEGQ